MRSWTFCWGINRLCQTAFWHASFCDSSTFFHESWAATVVSPTSPCCKVVPLWVGTLSQQPGMITSPKTLLPSELLQIMNGDFRTKQGCQQWTRSWLSQEQFLHQWFSGPRSSPSTFCIREKEDKVSHSLKESPKQHSTTQGMQIMLLLQNWTGITIISKRRQPNWSTLNSLASQRLQGSQGIYKSLNMICILLIKSELGVDSSTLLGLCRQEKDDQHNQLRSEKWRSNFSNKFRTN